eukprot:SAG11_NODE_1958_length_4000_cov_3.769546_4_plen_420_part_01
MWTIAVPPDAIPATLLRALSVGGTKFVVRPRTHDTAARPKIVATVYNVDERPLFAQHGGLRAIASAATEAYCAAAADIACEAVQELYKTALADERLPVLFARAVVSETDKNMGPVLVCRRWLDSRKIETILTPGFGIIGCYDEDHQLWRFSPRSVDADIADDRAGVVRDRRLMRQLSDEPGADWVAGSLEQMTAAVTAVLLHAVDAYAGPRPGTDPKKRGRLRSLRQLVEPLPHQIAIGVMGALPKVHKTPADSRPVVDLSNTNQSRASVLVHLGLLQLLLRVEEQYPACCDVIGAETSDSIARLTARLRAVASTGVDPRTAEFDTGDFESMYTNLNWPAAIEMIRYLGRIVGWADHSIIRIRRRETRPRGRHPGGCSELKFPDESDSFMVTFGEVLHLILCVCRYGLFLCITGFGSFLV